MDSDILDAQKNGLKNEESLINAINDVKPSMEYGLSKSRILLRQKDAHHTSILSSGKWLQIVRNSPRVSCEVTTSPSHFLSKLGEHYAADESPVWSNQSEKMHKKVSSLPSKTLFPPPSTDMSQGTLQFTKRANEKPCYVFKLESQKDVYTASLSSNVEDDSYMIYLQRGESSSAHLVGRMKVSSLLNERTIQREFVLFSSSNCELPQIPCRKKNRGGLSEKVVNVIKKNTQCISRLSRHDLSSWDDEQFEKPNYDDKQVNLLENNLPTNLETLAIVVKQEFLEEESGGWGLKFLKKSPLVQSETSRSLLSMSVVIPSGIHGGPEDGPLSLIERWKSEGNCDCGGWDLGCSLTLLKGQSRKEQCNSFELFIKDSKPETPQLRIVNVRGEHHIVQFQRNMSALQTFSIALAFIHSRNQELQPVDL